MPLRHSARMPASAPGVHFARRLVTQPLFCVRASRRRGCRLAYHRFSALAVYCRCFALALARRWWGAACEGGQRDSATISPVGATSAILGAALALDIGEGRSVIDSSRRRLPALSAKISLLALAVARRRAKICRRLCVTAAMSRRPSRRRFCHHRQRFWCCFDADAGFWRWSPIRLLIRARLTASQMLPGALTRRWLMTDVAISPRRRRCAWLTAAAADGRATRRYDGFVWLRRRAVVCGADTPLLMRLAGASFRFDGCRLRTRRSSPAHRSPRTRAAVILPPA